MDSEVVEQGETGVGVGPGLQAVPDQAEVVDDVAGPEIVEVAGSEELAQGLEVVLVYGFPG